MKKLALVLAVLLVVGGAAFAEVEVGGAATVSGKVATQIGMDLDSRVWGADATSSISISIPLANGSDGVAGDDDLYGEIYLTDVSVNIDSLGSEDADGEEIYGYSEDNDFGDLAARIVAGNFYIGLNWSGYNNDYADPESGDYNVNLSSDWYDFSDFGDLALGFSTENIDFELEVIAKNGLTRASTGDANVDHADAWSDDTDESDDTDSTQTGVNGLLFSVDVEYANDTFAFPVYATIDPDYMGDFLLGVSVDPSVAAGNLSVTAPVDFVMIGDVMGFDAYPMVSYDITDEVAASVYAYYYNNVDVASLLDAGIGVSTDGLVDGLVASVDFDLTDIMTSGTAAATMGWGVDVSAAMDLADGLTLTVEPGYDSTSDFDIAASLSMGAAFTGIDNTTLSIDYTDGMYDVDGDYASSDAGILSCTATISF
ncbi:MAG: hypothetical protein PQJ61_05060 [Spirochaetales bacterium]|uniref:Porin domain-containing protein n=1 Tax=Candidatus Thalassospirochaeta sargassi TaxID=3119039 RepID=A0AAJ1IBA8_9SPIO|nr:hypothetical protein [Spirochaetales bacterium]